MNSDEIESIIVKAIIAAGTAWATKHGVTVDGSSLQMLAGGMVAAGAGTYGVYRHWGMKKVPETAVLATISPTVAK